MLIGGLCYGFGFASMAAGVHYHSLGTLETRKNLNFLFDVLEKGKVMWNCFSPCHPYQNKK
jgi:hypothetical protein